MGARPERCNLVRVGPTMNKSDLLGFLLVYSVFGVMSMTCASTTGQKPFDQMTAQEHRVAAAQEHQRAADSFSRVHGENIEPPETMPTGEVYYYSEGPGSPYYYDSYIAEIDDPEAYVAWPRVSDPSEKYEEAAIEHRENAMRHERAAAALEGRPSPQPLPPPAEPLVPPDRG